MYNKLNQILELIKEIKIENDDIGNILMVNFKSAINTVEALRTKTQLDLNEKIELLSELLGIKIEDLIKNIIDNDYINVDDSDQETIDFILGTSKNINNTNKEIDDYEKFLEDNKVKENIDYLKGVL